MLSNDIFLKNIIKAGANEFALAIHGHNPKIHDTLTRSDGSFNQTLQAIKNVKKYNKCILMNTVVTKQNYRYLPKIAKMLVDLKVDQFQFAFVHPIGNAKKNFDTVVPRMTLAMPYIKKGLQIGIDAGISVMAEATPYCMMKGYENYVSERFIPETEIKTGISFDKDHKKTRMIEGKIKFPQCKKCKYNPVCEGPWKEYYEGFGNSEFNPINYNQIKKEKNNNLEYVSKNEEFFDYCHYKYNTNKESYSKLRSSNLLINSFDFMNCDTYFYQLLNLIRDKIGLNNTIWGIKKIDNDLFWELYFYNREKKNYLITIPTILSLINNFFKLKLEIPKNFQKLPYFMFSIDLSKDFFLKKSIEGVHIYLGPSYFLNNHSMTFENNYSFYDAKEEIKKIVKDVKDSSFIDFSKIKLSEILMPELINCKFICRSRKQKNDCIYYSRINIDQFIFFLKKFKYPKKIISFIEQNKSNLDHLLYDVGFDYTMENNKLKILKSGYYGSF